MSVEEPHPTSDLAPLRGILAPKTAYSRVEQDARSQELTDQIDEVGWDQWISGDHRLISTGQVDGCGCEIYHWRGADNDKSVTLHDGCEKGAGAHIWSGTMMADLELDGEHVSRLVLAAKLHEITISEAAAAVGIRLGAGGGDDLAPTRPEQFEQAADEAERRGDHAAAAKYRHAAKALRSHLPADIDAGEAGLHSRVAGGVVTPPSIGPFGTTAPDTGGDTAPAKSVTATAAQQVSDTDPDGDSGDVGVIVTFPGMAFDDVPVPGDNELYEYPYPPIPSHVPQVNGALTNWADVLPPLANRQSSQTVKHEWIFSATPGLSQVAAAADSRGVGRFGMLGALLPRVAAHIPPTVRLIPADGAVPSSDTPTGAGASLNMYVVVVGPPAAGKTVTLGAADALIPGVRMVPPGTGEGILKMFPRAGDDDGGDDGGDQTPHIGKAGAPYNPDSVLLSSDEIDVFVGEMMRQGSKASGIYRSMWMGGDVGNTASDRERHSMVEAHTYRFGIRLGAQPETVSPLFDENGRGTPQRFLWLTAQRMVARGPRYPERLMIAPVYWFNGAPSMTPQSGGPRLPVWIVPPPAARKHILAEEWRSATVNPLSPSGTYGRGAASLVDVADSIADRHAVLQRLKLSAALAVLDGLAQPQDAHWYASGAIMQVRRVAIRELVEVVETAQRDKAIKNAREHGVMRAHADQAAGREVREQNMDAQAGVIFATTKLTERRDAITWESVCTEVAADGGNPDFVNMALKTLSDSKYLTPIGDGNTYVITPPDADGTRKVRVLHAAPPIHSIGG